jgi:predicted DNA-binding protein
MPTKEKITPAQIRFPAELWKRAKAMAILDRRSTNALVVTIVEEGIAKMEADRKKTK